MNNIHTAVLSFAVIALAVSSVITSRDNQRLWTAIEDIHYQECLYANRNSCFDPILIDDACGTGAMIAVADVRKR